ncbi:MAG: hypothetical protein WA087_02690 [Candidatus Saccharimonadales bacterium]
MSRYNQTQILPIAVILVIIVVAIVALVSAARMLFFSGATTKTSSNQSSSQQALLDISVGREVRMTTRGPIVANEDFRNYEIVINSSNRTLTVFEGYNNKVVSKTKLPNTVAAYEQLVYALNRAGFMNGSELTGDNNDVRGICATGQLYDFQMLNKDEKVKDLWTTSCSAARGSFNASLKVIKKLFTDQIPDFRSKTSGLGF